MNSGIDYEFSGLIETVRQISRELLELAELLEKSKETEVNTGKNNDE